MSDDDHDFEMVVFDETTPQAIAVAEARFNAKSLLEDAQLLFDKGKWGASVSLAILACEEAGKFLIFNQYPDALSGKSRAPSKHKDKQFAFASHLKSCLRVFALDEYLESTGHKDPKERAVAALKIYDLAMINVEKGEAHGNALLNEIHQGVSKDTAFKIAEEAAAGLLDKVKQRGFYVDLEGIKVHSPRAFTETDAALYLRAAAIVMKVVAPHTLVGDKPIPMKQARVRFKASIKSG